MRRQLLPAACLGLALAGPASAVTITGLTGSLFQLGTPPASVVEEALESDTRIVIFEEQPDLALPSLISVNVVTPGTHTSSPGVSSIAAGTRVAVYFVHMDIIDVADGGSGAPINLSGSVTFDSAILGIIGTQGELDASDPTLGVATTSYPTGVNARGYWENSDSLTLSADRRTLTFNNMRVANNFTDQLRLILAAEPPLAALLGLAGLALGVRGRGRRDHPRPGRG